MNPFQTQTISQENNPAIAKQLELDNLADQYRAEATCFLAESSRKGYVIDPTILDNFIAQYSKEVESLKDEIYSEIRQIMGWRQQADVYNELPTPEQLAKPEPTQPSLFNI